MRIVTRGGARRGGVSVVMAAAIVAMVTATGLGVDFARMWLVQARLQAALDACALVAAREVGVTTQAADTAAMFWSNYASGHASGGAGYFGATASAPSITQVDQNTVTVASTARLPAVFAAYLGLSTIVISEHAQAVRATTGMELALVLDTTGSMAGAAMQSVRDSATELVNIVYGTGSQDTVANLWVSVAPFTAEVNMGPTHTSWLASGSYSASSYANGSWAGCVLARHTNGHDADDAPPSVAAFTPFLYASTLGKYTSNGKVVKGDDDWSASNITEGNQANLPANTAVGPDLGCGATPVLPLTASRTTVLSVINSLVATYRGGTFINLGLQAGWFTISPRWRGLWGSTTLPLDYNTTNMSKVIVLMTDGNNEWYSWPGGAPDNQGDADATAYGRLSTNVLGLTAANATTYLNASMSSMCTAIKANGVILYTILFDHGGGISSATQTLFQNCATSAQDYFLAPTAADLQSAFTTIGSQLAGLRLSQ